MFKRSTYLQLLVYLLILLEVGCGQVKPYRVSNFFVAEAINDLRAKRIAVLPFENLTNNPKAGQLIADELNLQMGKLHQFELVERIRIEELYKEQDLNPNRIDESTAVKIGRMLGAHAVVLGSVIMYKSGGLEEETSTAPAQTSSPVPVLIQDNTNKSNEWGLTETIILIGAVVSVVGLVYLFYHRKPAEVSVSVRLINVETGQQLWQARDTFNGKWRSVRALGQTKEERKRIKKDVSYLAQLLCQQLAETLKKD